MLGHAIQGPKKSDSVAQSFARRGMGTRAVSHLSQSNFPSFPFKFPGRSDHRTNMPPKKQAKSSKQDITDLATLAEAASSSAVRARNEFDTVIVNGEQILLNLDLFYDFKAAWEKIIEATEMPNLATAKVQLKTGRGSASCALRHDLCVSRHDFHRSVPSQFRIHSEGARTGSTSDNSSSVENPEEPRACSLSCTLLLCPQFQIK